MLDLPRLGSQRISRLGGAEEAVLRVEGHGLVSVRGHGGTGGSVRHGEVKAAVGYADGIYILGRDLLYRLGVAERQLRHGDAQLLAEKIAGIAIFQSLLKIHRKNSL